MHASYRIVSYSRNTNWQRQIQLRQSAKFIEVQKMCFSQEERTNSESQSTLRKSIKVLTAIFLQNRQTIDWLIFTVTFGP